MRIKRRTRWTKEEAGPKEKAGGEGREELGVGKSNCVGEFLQQQRQCLHCSPRFLGRTPVHTPLCFLVPGYPLSVVLVNIPALRRILSGRRGTVTPLLSRRVRHVPYFSEYCSVRPTRAITTNTLQHLTHC